jgi:hypothetical protein
MLLARPRGRGHSVLLAALLAYGLVLAVTPLLHHDLECHWRTPGHCVACIASPVALGTEAAEPQASPFLVDLGRVETAAPPATDPVLLASEQGRAPPA